MRFNPKARIDTGRVQDAGGSGGGMGGGMGGPMRIPMPGGAVGGGAGGLLVLVLMLVLFMCQGGLGGSGGPSGNGGGSLDNSRMDTNQASGTDRYASCKTGADAQNSEDCARVAVENSLTDYWSGLLGSKFQPENSLVTFTGQVNTGCGAASSQVGPFYCPNDQNIYLDSTFFRDVLQGQLGGPAGAFVEPYVIGHEYGHHIQNILGIMSRVRTQKGPRSDAVRLELEADCFAGMWTKNATSTPGPDGEVLIQDLTDQDIQEAIAAAQSVGDDRIQQQIQGQVNPDSWTHGSAQSRVNWFTTGYQQGSLDACEQVWKVDTP